MFVVLLQLGDVRSPILIPVLNHVFLILLLSNHTLCLGVTLGRIDFHIEILSRKRVNPPIVQLAHALLHVLLKHAHQTGLHPHRLQQIHLGLGFWEPVKNPTIHTAVTLADSLINQAEEDLIWDWKALLSGFSQLDLDWRIALGLLAEDLGWADANQTEGLSDKLSLSGLARAWWSNEDHSGRSSWSVLFEADAEHAGQVVADIVERLVNGIVLVDKLVEDLFNTSHVHLVLLVNLQSDFIGHVVITVAHFLVVVQDVLLYAANRDVLLDLDVHDLVWDHFHLLKRKSLYLGTREALNDPALILLFVSVNLLLDQLDNDLIVDIDIVLQAFFNALSVRTLVSDVLAKHLSSGDFLPLKVVTEHLDVIVAAGAWSSQKENSLDLVLLDLLEKEF